MGVGLRIVVIITGHALWKATEDASVRGESLRYGSHGLGAFLWNCFDVRMNMG